jgi:Flp pilus assembly protein TadB
MSGPSEYIKLFILGALVGCLVVLVAAGFLGLSATTSLALAFVLSMATLVVVPEMRKARKVP